METRNSWQEGLSTAVVEGLNQLASECQSALGKDLVSITIFGSAAEGRLRVTSDVNIALVLKCFDPRTISALRDAMQSIAAAINLEPMLLLESEVQDAAEAFAVKFSDISMRRRVVYGSDIFAGLHISRDAILRRLKQILLNQILRLRQALALFNDAGQTRAVIDSIGPLRSAAASLLRLEGQSVSSPRQALIEVLSAIDADNLSTLERMQSLRESGDAVVSDAQTLLGELIAITNSIYSRAAGLSPS